MNKATCILVAVSALAGSLSAGAAAESGPVAVPLNAVAAARAGVNPGAVCPRLKLPCDPKTTRLYSTASAWYLIDSSRPMLVMLDARFPEDLARAAQWDFSGYRHSYPAPVDPADTPLTIHPALYKTGGEQLAIALVATVNESYAGGGASFQVADFVVPGSGSDNSAGAWRLLHKSVPFFCSKAVRACFSDKERRESLHCAEESRGHLTLHGSPETWAFVWNEFFWPAHVKKIHARNQRQAFQPAQDASLPASASFCGGPQ